MHTVIPETPESVSATTPSSSRRPKTKIDIPETPTSTKSISSRCKASKSSPERTDQEASPNLAKKYQVTSGPFRNVIKNSNKQGFKSQGITSASSHKANSGEDMPDRKEPHENEDEDDDHDEYLPIPETQFCIPETQFPNEKSPTETKKPHSLFDNILTSYQKKIESKAKIQSKTTKVSPHLDSKKVMASIGKPRNVFGCQSKERRKSGHNTPLGSSGIGNHGNSKSERKIITAKRTINKLSRTHRKMGVSMGKVSQPGSKINREKDVSLDQADLDLLQDCLSENTVVVAPSKTLKLSKPKIKKHRISPANYMSKKELPGFDDVDCSVLEGLLEDLPDKDLETSKERDSAKEGSSVIKPSMVPLKCQNQVRTSLPLAKIRKDKMSEMKIGSQKRSPCRGNSPYAKRIQGESNLAKPGGHVKSLFQEKQLDLNPIKVGSKKVVELQSLDDLDDVVIDDASMMETSQPFTDVRNMSKENQLNSAEKEQEEEEEEEEADISVSAVLEKTPNRLGQSPCKMPDGQFVSPAAGSDALWDGLNDSFMLAAADFDVLDEMAADAMGQVSINYLSYFEKWLFQM